VGLATCRLCGGRECHCFDLGTGDALILPCPACGVGSGLSAGGRAVTPCRSCGLTIPFPSSPKAKKQLLVCYGCLRVGKAAMTKSIEIGMISWEQESQEARHGVTGLRTDQLEPVPIDPCEDWYAVRVPSEHLRELLRTTGFHSWQEERWLFGCRRPMTYIGADLCRSSFRRGRPPMARGRCLGFRCVGSAPDAASR
jgi:uncharacterized protein CbrC (UPF0167 family)